MTNPSEAISLTEDDYVVTNPKGHLIIPSQNRDKLMSHFVNNDTKGGKVLPGALQSANKRKTLSQQKKEESKRKKSTRLKMAAGWRDPNNTELNDVSNLREDSAKLKQEQRELEKGNFESFAPELTVDQNGDIIVNEKSLVYQEKFTTLQEGQIEDYGEEVERITNASFGKKRTGSRKFDKEEMLLFYTALRMCGQDFSSMEMLFPNRCRKQLVRKFKAEQRSHPKLIKLALDVKNKLPLDSSLMCTAREKDVKEQIELLEKNGNMNELYAPLTDEVKDQDEITDINALDGDVMVEKDTDKVLDEDDVEEVVLADGDDLQALLAAEFA